MIDHGSEVVDLFEAMRMLDVPEEVLGRLAEQGKLKSRRADGTVYFLRAEIEALSALVDEQPDAYVTEGTQVIVCRRPDGTVYFWPEEIEALGDSPGQRKQKDEL
jgi:hypothetical protein